MKKLFWQVFLTVIFVFFPGFASVTQACSCSDYNVPPCAAYWQADSVFTGLVTEVTPLSVDSKDGYHGGALVHFTVEQSFRGSKDAKLEVISEGEQSMCGRGFKPGQRWLVYASRDSNGKLTTSFCDRTTQLPAEEDLAYIMGVSGRTAAQSILGRIREHKDEHLERIKISIEDGSSKYQTLTDKDGQFSVSLPRPGTYKVRLFIPYSAILANVSNGYEEIKAIPTEKLTLAEYDVTVPPNQCDYRFIEVAPKDLKATAEIRGTVFDSEGLAVRGQFVYLYPATSDHKLLSEDSKWAQTDKDGNYKFEGLREGRYWLGINIDQIPEPGSPYPTTFYPGAQDIKKATAITLKQGQQLSKKNIQLPPKLVEREITGSIVWPDGRPALAPPSDSEFRGLRPDITVRDPNSWGSLSTRRSDGSYAEAVDDGGQFSFFGFEGYSYVIYASAYDTDGKRVRSKAVKITLTEDLKPLVLVLSSPGGYNEDELKKELSGKP